MKIIAFSDTHGGHWNVKVPPCDLLLFAGDIAGDQSQMANEDFLRWINAQPADHIVMIAGNHDWLPYQKPGLFATMVAQICTRTHYLENSGAEIEGLRIWGSPWTPEFNQWAFNAQRGSAIRRHWDLIPDDTDILITHGPMIGILDKASGRGKALGCQDLYEAVLRVKPRLHVCGHIHGSGGTTMRLVHDDGSKTLCANVSVLNEVYKMVSAPLEIDSTTL